jgi:N6-L-threonylcarbamoyladenine synthase
MKILSIETSCDETAVSLVEAKGGLDEPFFRVAGNALFSQIEVHKKYGGVFPALAKREHGKNLAPLLVDTLTQAGEYVAAGNNVKHPVEIWQKIEKLLNRENDLAADLKNFFDGAEKPDIDFIAVTAGPGLEPALWVGISFASALGALWNIPVLPINHMEGHITSVLLSKNDATENEKTETKNQIQFPAVALLISGGHTELVEISGWGKYKIIGETKDDAVGEAFDKVARMLSLPYPGGPEISRLAEIARTENLPHKCKLPRPMMHSGDLNFSFSGLKTAVLYWIRDHGELSETDKRDIAREFEDAVVEVLVHKTEAAVEQVGAKTLIVAGGVISNKELRKAFQNFNQKYSDLTVRIPLREMTTDNSLMIAIAGFVNVTQNPKLLQTKPTIIANGNLRL